MNNLTLLQNKNNRHNYNFYVHIQPNLFNTSSHIVITTYSHPNQSTVLPCKFQWYKTKNGIIRQVSSIKHNVYVCEPSDLGAIIKVQITSLNQLFSGTAVFEFKITQIDINTKKNVENIIKNGFGSYSVFLNNHKKSKQCILIINQNFIKLQSILPRYSYKFQYSYLEPKFQLHINDSSKLDLILLIKATNELKDFFQHIFPSQETNKLKSYDHQSYIRLTFKSRLQRDSFMLINKYYISKKQLINQIIIRKIQNINLDENQDVYSLMGLQQLKWDLSTLNQKNNQIQKQKQFFKKQIQIWKNNQKQINLIPLQYKYQGGKDEDKRINEKLMEVVNRQKVELQSLIRIMRKQKQQLQKEVDNIRQKNREFQMRLKNRNIQEDLYKGMKEEIERLKNENDELKHRIMLMRIQEDTQLMMQLQNRSIQIKNYIEKQRKLNKRIQELLQQVKILKKNNKLMNKSRNLTIQMDMFQEQQIQLIKTQNQYFRQQIQQLNKKNSTQYKQHQKLKQSFQKLLKLQTINPFQNSFK